MCNIQKKTKKDSKSISEHFFPFLALVLSGFRMLKLFIDHFEKTTNSVKTVCGNLDKLANKF